MNELLHLFFL